MMLVYSSVSCQETKLSYYDSTGIMPAFRYYSAEGTLFTPDNLNKNHKTVFIYYENGCPFCEKQAEIISACVQDFKATDFIFLTRDDTANMRSFKTSFKLANIESVKFLQDKERLYHRYYITYTTPSIHIYDKIRKLILFRQAVLNKAELLKYIE
jgi:thiol-disulfide isomerase/thioredoxin